MKKKKPKFKIRLKNKSYALSDCALYKIHSKKKLATLLYSDLATLEKLKKDVGNYRVYEQVNKETKKKRTIEEPKNLLDKIHTRIASLLCRVSQPSYIHSGVIGYSNVTNAKAHIGIYPVLTTDIKSFFPSTTRKMVFDFFYEKLLCSPDVADILSYLCTFNGHIPTGSRISMPLAFWANYKMFDELHTLSKSKDITMTVYVDDVTFSGKNVNDIFKYNCVSIISRHNHTAHPVKTILYKFNQPKLITGVIVFGNDIKIRNKQHEKLFNDLELWKLSTSNEDKLKLEKKILGRLYSLSTIDGTYLDKARTFTHAMSSVS